MADANARITRLLAEPPHHGELGLFLPAVNDSVSEWELRCRAALASTFVAGLELARAEALRLEQVNAWRDIVVSGSQTVSNKLGSDMNRAKAR